MAGDAFWHRSIWKRPISLEIEKVIAEDDGMTMRFEKITARSLCTEAERKQLIQTQDSMNAMSMGNVASKVTAWLAAYAPAAAARSGNRPTRSVGSS